MTSSTEHREKSLSFLTIFACFALSCADSSSDSTSGQRRVSEASVSELELRAQIVSGAIRTISPEGMRARSAAPLARLTLTGDSLATGLFNVELTNLSPLAEPIPVGVTAVDSPTCESDETPVFILCSRAQGSIGNPCGAASDCEAGTTCVDSTCVATPILSACNPLNFERSLTEPTALTAEVPLEPCRSVVIDFAPPTPSTSAEFAVIGSTSSLNRLDSVIRNAATRGAEFVVILGENLDAANVEAVDALERRLQASPVPIVFVASPNANQVEEGQYALRRFGPHDFNFVWNQVSFVVFFTPQHQMDEAAITRLETFLRPLRRSANNTRPLLAFTHTPPIDPDGIRNLGFESRTQGSRVLSVLDSFGTNALFAGRINASDFAQFGGIGVWITSANDSVLEDQRKYLWVSAKGEGDFEVSTINF